VQKLAKEAAQYANTVRQLLQSSTTTEATFYPGLRSLIAAALADLNLPFDVRINTSERKSGGGINLPDVALYDSDGAFVVVAGEVKLPTVDLDFVAMSTDRKDQVGRYLEQTKAILVSNVRSIALVTVDATKWSGSGPVPPAARRIEQVVDFWASTAAARVAGNSVSNRALEEFTQLIETAVTRYAPIAEPESLARILARQAKRAKADLPPTFTNAVQSLLDDFGKALGVSFVGQEGEEFFRSSLVQTAFYGLFAGWALWWQGTRAQPFRWEDLSDYLKIPFLASLFHEFRHPSRIREIQLAKHLDLATETLMRVDATRFFQRFELPRLNQASATAASTAIQHFYEPFLAAFDPDLRKQLGVWYTPSAIVHYQVAKIDKLLRTELGCPRGFADERVIVLDPACGTGAYLLEVLKFTSLQLAGEGAGATLAARLRDAICRRFIGFEILPAPFVVAQLQIYIALANLGVAPDEKHRPAIFLSNALTGWHGPDQMRLNFPELQEEHDAARSVKRQAKIIVVLGNPPYNRFVGVPQDEEAELADYYKGIARDDQGKQLGQSELYTRWGVRKQLLNELYVRFFRLAELRIGVHAEFGVVSYISNSSFLVGRSHPLMRESLLRNFDAIWVDNLHGNRIASERTPWGQSCETIFSTGEIGPGIKPGTCITTMLKRPSPTDRPAKLFIRDFWGRAEAKRTALVESIEMDVWDAGKRQAAALAPEGPRDYVLFTTSESNRYRFAPAAAGGFEEWPGFDDLFVKSFQGVNPNRGLEGSVIDVSKDALENRMRNYFKAKNFSEVQTRYPELTKPRARFDARAVREELLVKGGYDEAKIQPYLLFPMDYRWIYYETEAKFLNEARSELSEHLENNEFLIGTPLPRRPSERRPLVTSALFDLHLHDVGSVGFPAIVKPKKATEQRTLFAPTAQDSEPHANLHQSVWDALRIGWRLRGDLRGRDAKRVVPDLFRYCLAIAHAPQYDIDNGDYLSQDWPHIPIAKDQSVFHDGVALGEKLLALLDTRADTTKLIEEVLGPHVNLLGVMKKVNGTPAQAEDLKVEYSYYGAASGRWKERQASPPESDPWGDVTGDLFLSRDVFLSHVPDVVWRFELGGYPVIKKWLGYRHATRRDGAPLTLNELDTLVGIVRRIACLLSLMPKLNALYAAAVVNPWLVSELAPAEAS
jgi:hypothetical protein